MQARKFKIGKPSFNYLTNLYIVFGVTAFVIGLLLILIIKKLSIESPDYVITLIVLLLLLVMFFFIFKHLLNTKKVVGIDVSLDRLKIIYYSNRKTLHTTSFKKNQVFFSLLKHESNRHSGYSLNIFTRKEESKFRLLVNKYLWDKCTIHEIVQVLMDNGYRQDLSSADSIKIDQMHLN